MASPGGTLLLLFLGQPVGPEPFPPGFVYPDPAAASVLELTPHGGSALVHQVGAVSRYASINQVTPAPRRAVAFRG